MVVVQAAGKYSGATNVGRSVFSFEFVEQTVDKLLPVSYTHLTLPTIA